VAEIIGGPVQGEGEGEGEGVVVVPRAPSFSFLSSLRSNTRARATASCSYHGGEQHCQLARGPRRRFSTERKEEEGDSVKVLVLEHNLELGIKR